MIADYLPQVLSAATIGAITPIATLVTIAILATPGGAAKAFALLTGWTAALVALAIAVSLLLDDAGPALSSATKATLDVVLGFVLISLGVRRAIGSRHPLHAAVADGVRREAVPRWLQAIDSLTPLRAFGFGFVLLAASPANVAVYLSAIQSMRGVGLGDGGFVLTALLIAAIGLCIIVPLGVYVAMPSRADELLGRGRDWLLANQQRVMAWVLLGFGALLVFSGAGGLG